MRWPNGWTSWGTSEKIVQPVLRHAKPHLAKDRYIKAFDPSVLAGAADAGGRRWSRTAMASSWPAAESKGMW